MDGPEFKASESSIFRTYRLAVGPTHPPLHWIVGVKQSGRETDHSKPPNGEIENKWSYISTPPCPCAFEVFVGTTTLFL
jgi:hypothetical protein